MIDFRAIFLSQVIIIFLSACESKVTNLRSNSVQIDAAKVADDKKINQNPNQNDARIELIPELKLATKKGLHWKRIDTISNDLRLALKLEAEDLCFEQNGSKCANDIFSYALGGHSAIEKGQYQPAMKPLATTPLALERLIVGACAKRLELDLGASANDTSAVLFNITNVDTITAEESNKIINELYRRFLHRDPIAGELAKFDAREYGNPKEFLFASCIAIGSSIEFLFYNLGNYYEL